MNQTSHINFLLRDGSLIIAEEGVEDINKYLMVFS